MQRILLNLSKISLAIWAITFISCTDPCRDTDCRNGGFCAEGACHCPFPYQGVNCEERAERLYRGGYQGYNVCNGMATGLTCALVLDSVLAKDEFNVNIETGELYFILFSQCDTSITPFPTLKARLTNEFSFVFDKQILNLTPNLWLTGTGTLLKPDTIRLNYTLSSLNGQDVSYCTVDYVR